mgnify:CR=1 FL=1
MKNIFRRALSSLKLGILVSLAHTILIGFIFQNLIGENNSRAYMELSFVASVLFILTFGLPIYLCVSLLYQLVTDIRETRILRYIKGFPLVLIGYILSMSGHISDGDWHWLNWKTALFFLLALPLLVEIDHYLIRRSQNNS